MSRKRSHSPGGEHVSVSQKESERYFRSNPIEDRNSTFVGLFSPTTSAKDLQNLPEFKTASHRMAGWRKASTQRTLNVGSRPTGNPIYVAGSDDDHEKYGGKRLEKVLNDLNVEGAVVVARWYGGVLLGPVRFTHIENTAREAVMLWKNSADDAIKKRRIGEAPPTDFKEKERLVKALLERDQSVAILRQLLAEKSEPEKQSKASNDAESSSAALSPSKGPDYAAMPLQRLQQLEKARDATIAWILRQIDAAEAKTATTADGKSKG